MAKIQWTGTIDDCDSNVIEVTIVQDVSGTITENRQLDINSITISKNTGEELFTTVVTTSVDMVLNAHQNLEYIEFFDLNAVDDPIRHLVTIRRGFDIIFRGQIASDLYSEPHLYTDENTSIPVTVQCACGLSRLDRVSRGYLTSNPLFTLGEKRPLWDLLQDILLDTGYNLPIHYLSSLQLQDSVIDSEMGGNALSEMYIDPRVWQGFESIDEQQILATSDIILNDIMTAGQGMRIYQDLYNGDVVWRVERYADIERNLDDYLAQVDWKIFNPCSTTDGVWTARGIYVSSYSYNNLAINNDVLNNIESTYWIGSSQVFESEKGIERQKVSVEWQQIPNQVINGDFEDGFDFSNYPYVDYYNSTEYKVYDPDVNQYTNTTFGYQRPASSVDVGWIDSEGNDDSTYILNNHIFNDSIYNVSKFNIDTQNKTYEAYIIGKEFSVDFRTNIPEGSSIRFGFSYTVGWSSWEDRSEGEWGDYSDPAHSSGGLTTFHCASIPIRVTFNNGDYVYENLSEIISISTGQSARPVDNGFKIDDVNRECGFINTHSKYPYGAAGTSEVSGVPYEVQYSPWTGRLEFEIDTRNLKGVSSISSMQLQIIAPNVGIRYGNAYTNVSYDFDKLYIDDIHISVDDNIGSKTESLIGGIDGLEYRKEGEEITMAIGSDSSALYLSTIFNSDDDKIPGFGETGIIGGDVYQSLPVGMIQSVLSVRQLTSVKLSGQMRSGGTFIPYATKITDDELPSAFASKKFLPFSVDFDVLNNTYNMQTIEIFNDRVSENG